jgi:hypothetical protein
LHEALGIRQETVFVGHDAQTRADAEKFTGGEEKVRPRRRPTVSLPAANVS